MWLRNGNPTASVGVGGSGGVGWSSMRAIFPGTSQAASNLHTAWALRAAFRQGFQTADAGGNGRGAWSHVQGVPSGYGGRAALLPLTPGGVASQLSGSGTFTGTQPQEGRIVAASLAGAGALSAPVLGIGLLYASPAGSGLLTADAAGTGVALAALSGTGTLAGAVEGGAAVIAALGGGGVLVGTAEGGALVIAALDGSGDLAGAAQGGAAASAILVGSGSLASAVVGTIVALADLSGGGSLAAAVDAVGLLVAELEGTGVLDADAPVGVGFVEADIGGAGGGLTVDVLSAGALQSIVASLLGSLIAQYDDPNTLGQVFNTTDAVNRNRIRLNKATGVLTIYEPDMVTPRLTFQIKDDDGNNSSSQQYDREPT